MDLMRSQVKTMDLILKLLRGDMRHITPYPFTPQKPAFQPDSNPDIPFSTPEREGVPSGKIEDFFQALDRNPDVRPHSVMILRHGKIIAECSWKPYTATLPHMMFSLSKSVVGMAVGMAVEEGLLNLDERVVDIFPDKLIMFKSPRMNAVRVRHLLNMSTGVNFNEVGSVVEKDWVRAYLQSDCAFEPGTQFCYNSMNTYLLSAIVCRRAGMNLKDYLSPRLFQPLNIPSPAWDECPMGVEKGGWGLWLRTADMAKLGQLYLQKGRWMVDGEWKQLVPEPWVTASTNANTETRKGDHASRYGYQLWGFDGDGAYQFNGVFGQYVIVLPRRDLVIAITSGSQELFSDASSALVAEYFGDYSSGIQDMPLKDNLRALSSLTKEGFRLRYIPETAPKPAPRTLYDKAMAVLTGTRAPALTPEEQFLNGREYVLDKSFGTLLPLILEGCTNNFCSNIQKVAFDFTPGEVLVSIDDGENRNQIAAGTDRVPRRGTVNLNGETYAVGATARLTTDEDDRPVLKVFLSFLETPCTRLLKFIFHRDGQRVLVRFDELPSVAAASKMLMGLVGGASLPRLLEDSIVQQRLADRVKEVTLPVVRGKLLERSAEVPEKAAVTESNP